MKAPSAHVMKALSAHVMHSKAHMLALGAFDMAAYVSF